MPRKRYMLGLVLNGFAPDGAVDRLRTLGNTAGAGLGVLAAAPWIPGASDVKTARGTVNNTTTRADLVAAVSGKKLRVVYFQILWTSATVVTGELYVGTGANITTTAGKEIAQGIMDVTDNPTEGFSFPDGGGPVSGTNEAVSMRNANTVAVDLIFMVGYREE